MYFSKLGVTKQELEKLTRFPVMTIKYVLDDLKMLNIVKTYGTVFKIVYELTDYAKEIITKGEIYSNKLSHVHSMQISQRLAPPKK